MPTLVNTNIQSSMQREVLNHKRLSSSHSHDKVTSFITVLAADRWPVNSYHSYCVTNNPNGTLKISSQFTEVYPDNRTLQIIEVNFSLTTHVLRTVVITDTEENTICRISVHSRPVSGYQPDTQYIRSSTESTAQTHGKLHFHIQHRMQEKVPEKPPLTLQHEANRSTNFLRPFVYCCFILKVKTMNIICMYSILTHKRNVRYTVLHKSCTLQSTPQVCYRQQMKLCT